MSLAPEVVAANCNTISTSCSTCFTVSGFRKSALIHSTPLYPSIAGRLKCIARIL